MNNKVSLLRECRFLDSLILASSLAFNTREIHRVSASFLTFLLRDIDYKSLEKFTGKVEEPRVPAARSVESNFTRASLKIHLDAGRPNLRVVFRSGDYNRLLESRQSMPHSFRGSFPVARVPQRGEQASAAAAWFNRNCRSMHRQLSS